MSELSELKIKYRDLLARGLDQELANRDLEIVRLNAALADRDHGIVSLNAALAARDREIERLTTRISGRHARVRLWRACTLKDMCASVHMSACYWSTWNWHVLGLAIDVQETNDKCNLKIARAVVRAVQSKDEQLAAKDKEITRTAAGINELMQFYDRRRTLGNTSLSCPD
jgi:hypothetical protein